MQRPFIWTVECNLSKPAASTAFHDNQRNSKSN